MNTAEDWKHEADTGGCRACRGLGYLPATHSRGAIPCGCDEPTEDDAEQVGTKGEARSEPEQNHHPIRGEGEPVAWKCDGCDRLCRYPEDDIIDLRNAGHVSCCPERKMRPLYAHPPTTYGKGEREAVADCIGGGSTFTREDRLDMAEAILQALQLGREPR